MIKKIAFFVEGKTEQEFTVKLIRELLGKKNARFEIFEQFRSNLVLQEVKDDGAAIYNILIACCNTDNQIKSQINENYNRLVQEGYSYIVGLRDVYPLTHADVPKVLSLLNDRLVQGPVPIILNLAILEIESWFLQECTHFQRISPDITHDMKLSSGYDCDNVNAESIANPADMLHTIYSKVGMAYKKRGSYINRTIGALSFEEVYVNCSKKSASLNAYIQSIETSLFSET